MKADATPPKSAWTSLVQASDRMDFAVDKWWETLRGNPIADRIFYSASAVGDHSVIWLMLGAARGARSEHHWRAAMRLTGALAVESALINGVVKSIFRRKRPVWELVRPLPLRQPRTSSFPSGHATSAFLAASLLSEDDAAAPLYYALAVVVATSRIHVRIHHASDVVAGAAIGALMGAAVRRLVPLDH